MIAKAGKAHTKGSNNISPLNINWIYGYPLAPIMLRKTGAMRHEPMRDESLTNKVSGSYTTRWICGYTS